MSLPKSSRDGRGSCQKGDHAERAIVRPFQAHDFGAEHISFKRGLADNAAAVACWVLGHPNTGMSSKTELRFGNKGSLSVVIDGPKKGAYFDYEAGIGGDLLHLIQRTQDVGFREALAVAERLVGRAAPAQLAPLRVACKAAKTNRSDKNKRTALELWANSVDLRGTVAERYLASRGIGMLGDGMEEVLRFHPAGPFGCASLPMLVALYRDIVTNEPCGVHRTALTQDGEKIDRKCLGRKRGAAIKLTANEDVEYGIAVGEGIETCLSGIMLGFAPAWALGDAGELGCFPVLPGIDGLTIFVDHDKTGQTQAARCRERWRAAGRDVVEVTTTCAGDDLNDLLRASA